jgi:DNA-binding response OmpR family regulator
MPESAPVLLAKSPATNGANAHRVLIIDDEAAIRESLETLLGLEGYLVEMAADGARGLAMLDQTNYDLILLDLAVIMMTGTSGCRASMSGSLKCRSS